MRNGDQVVSVPSNGGDLSGADQGNGADLVTGANLITGAEVSSTGNGSGDIDSDLMTGAEVSNGNGADQGSSTDQSRPYHRS